MNKDKIKNILLVMIVAVISGSLSSILTTNTISTNKLLGLVSYSDYLDSSNVTYLESNVQDSIDNLYTQANDYSTVNNKIDSYFQADPTSYFYGNSLLIGRNKESSTNPSIQFYNGTNPLGSIYINKSSSNELVFTSANGAPLGLYGNPVKINDVDVSTINDLSITTNSSIVSEGNVAGYKLGYLCIITINTHVTQLTNNVTYEIATLNTVKAIRGVKSVYNAIHNEPGSILINSNSNIINIEPYDHGNSGDWLNGQIVFFCK